jgi:hypothetical protein
MMHRFCAGIAGVAGLALLLSLPAAEPAQPARSAWTLDEAMAQLRLHPQDPYLQYVALQLARRQGNVDEIADQIDTLTGRDWRIGRGGTVDVFSLFTGALAVQESLQLDTMRGPMPPAPVEEGAKDTSVELDKRRRETVNVADLTGPTIKGHPWKKMLAGRKPEIDPLARMVPADFYFVQFRSITKMMDLLDSGDLWSTHLFSQAFREARTQQVGERIRRQLAIETNPLLQPFYDLVAEEVAVTGSDLFVREGSDVTVIIRFKQAAVFKARMDSFLASAAKSNPDARRVAGEYLGVKYDHLATPDRRLCVYAAYPADNIHIRSNSKVALQRVLEAIRGKTPAGKAVQRLGDTAEFAYIRTIYPRGAREEDGFIYLSDPFIRRLVGPVVKLTERRRMLCYNHLRMIGNAAQMYQTEHGKPPADLDTLHSSRCCPEPFRGKVPPADAALVARLIKELDSNEFAVREKASAELTKLGARAEPALRKAMADRPPLEVTQRLQALLARVEAELICPDGGTYALSADGKHGVCSHHGHARFLTPNLEIPVARVQGDEADAYKQFLDEYNQYWRTFFDPIAIRIQVTPQRYRLETIVLPLIDNSIYTGMALALGGQPEHLDAAPVPRRNMFSLSLRYNKDELAKLAGDIEDGLDELLENLGAKEKMAHKLDVKKFLSQGVGNQIGLHVYDSVQNFHFNVPEALGMMMGSGGVEFSEMLLPAFALTGLNSPVYLSVPARDPKIVESFGDQLEVIMAHVARRGQPGFIACDFYLVPFKGDPGKMMRSFAVQVGPVKLRYFWALIGNTVYIASKEFILEDLLALEKAPPKAEPAAADEIGHALIKVRPNNWDQALADYRLGWSENHRQACLNNHGLLSSVARTYTSTIGKIDEKELAQLGDRIVRAAHQLNQVHCYCPAGGRYVLAPDGKTMTCSIHGSGLAPRQPATPAEGKHFNGFAGLTATLTFMKEGLRAVLVIDR